MAPLLEIRGLEVSFPGTRLPVTPLRGASLEVGRGEIVGLVGESGAGKTLTALAVLGLVPSPGRITGGSIRLDGRELLALGSEELRRIRGGEIGLVFQEPASALNPVLPIGRQLAETVRAHQGAADRGQARAGALELLRLVAFAEPERRFDAYAHELSGGQRQRVMIALALAGGPRLLLADEPTAALDLSLQAEILDLLRDLRDRLDLGVVLISHDLAVVEETCDRVVVLYRGEVVESAPAEALFERPAHPYTRALVGVMRAAGERPRTRGPLPVVPGQPPSGTERTTGCAFHPRCAERLARCEHEPPPWIASASGGVRCHARRPPSGAQS